ncbi:MAG: NAD(P)H-hydrate dehydratase [Hyphomicrobiales bacterium]|nr:MAG: NAD(P)H-hydrate dehydratase [Hyphomicrobiales bacterium]
MNTVSIITNTPDIWRDCFPRPAASGHKYNRGHALIFAAPSLTGATRLAAGACSRIGAGLVSVLVHDNGDIYRATLDADIMVSDGQAINADKIAVAMGGSGGMDDQDYQALLQNRYNCPRVFDADAIPHSQDFSKLDSHCVLTPHGGEFARKFPDLSGDKADMALDAAKATGAIVVLKGAETIIAHPDGRRIVNVHASPYLAKAGTGDVLAGMIAGLIAQRMPIFEACCAGVWMHGDAAIRFGPGLIASDIIDIIPAILGDILT